MNVHVVGTTSAYLVENFELICDKKNDIYKSYAKTHKLVYLKILLNKHYTLLLCIVFIFILYAYIVLYIILLDKPTHSYILL